MSRYSIPGRASDAGPEVPPVEDDDCDASYDAYVEDLLEDRE